MSHTSMSNHAPKKQAIYDKQKKYKQILHLLLLSQNSNGYSNANFSFKQTLSDAYVSFSKIFNVL